jgi:AbrB family looped-hinge helix DNA binding protein
MKVSTTHQEIHTMKELLSVVTRKGQITVPAEIRQAIGLKQGDQVAFEIEGDAVKIKPARSSIKDFYQTVPALDSPRTWKEITELAHEEAAQEAAKEGLPQ